jgi:hypothetical protein
MRANTLADRGTAHIRAGGLRFLHARKWQGADCSKTAGHEPGLAKETAPVETADGLIDDRRCEMAAT